MPPPNRRRRRREDPRLASLPEEDKRLIREKQELRRKMELPLPQAGVQLRTANLLEANEYETVEDVLKATKASLMSIENFGDKTMVELFWAIKDLGLEPPADWGKYPRPKS